MVVSNRTKRGCSNEFPEGIWKDKSELHDARGSDMNECKRRQGEGDVDMMMAPCEQT